MASNVIPDNEEDLDLQSMGPSSLEDESFPSGLTETGGLTKPSLTDGWQMDESLNRCLLQMFDSQLWTDVMFRCRDQAHKNLDDRVRAHKVILAARSPVFQAMFFGPCQDTNAEVEIHDAESDHFKIFLKLLYSDDFDLYDKYDDLVHVLALAHKYQVRFVVDGCCRELGAHVAVENACALLDNALLYDNDYLIGVVSDFIDQNAEDVLVTDGFLEMSLRCLTYILKGNTFNAKENDIFHCVMEWARQRCDSTDGQDLRETLGEAFYYLRTPTMTKTEFIICTKKRGYYSPDDYERIMSRLSNPKASVEEITSNSTVPRRPLEFTLRRPKGSGTLTHEYGRSISETLSITVNDDVVLTDINLKCISDGKVGDSKCTFTDTPLSVTIMVNNGNVHSSTHTLLSGNRSSEIHLFQPIAMSPRKSYELNVKVEQKAVENMYLGVDKYTDSDEFVGCKDVIVKSHSSGNYGFYSYGTTNAAVLEYLTLKYKSKRN